MPNTSTNFQMLPKSTEITTLLQFKKIPNFLNFSSLESISQPPFSWLQSSNLTQSLNNLKLHKSTTTTTTTNLIFQSSNSINSEENQSKIMVRQLKLPRTFRSIKPHSTQNPNPKIEIDNISEIEEISSKISCWCVYLIASTTPPLKTYVGVTVDFPRRLKQHNGELKGGAKASRSGRPWVCACLIQGFRSQSEACEFESKWKMISRKLPRKKKSEPNEGLEDKGRLLLLQHRHAAMEKLKHSFDCDHLEVDWQLSPL